jgi:MerR family transcriptional regulator, light-induced transcriptional regulator
MVTRDRSGPRHSLVRDPLRTRTPIGAGDRLALVSAVESLALPEVARRFGAARLPSFVPENAGDRPDPDVDVVRFADQLLTQGLGPCLREIDGLRRRGIADETICLEWLAPAARHLGGLWEQDQYGFHEITVAVARIESLVLDLRFDSPVVRPSILVPASCSAMVSPMPGSDHTLGPLIVSEFLAAAGWAVRLVQRPRAAELLRRIHDDWTDMLAISIQLDSEVSAATALIARLRRSSVNTRVKVMAGGSRMLANPGLVAVIGADFMATDARDAIERAAYLIGSPGRTVYN